MPRTEISRDEACKIPRDSEDNHSFSIWSVFLGGFLTAFCVTCLICKLPNSHSLTWRVLWLLTVCYLSIAFLANAGAMWVIYKASRRKINIPFLRLLWPASSVAMSFPLLILLFKEGSIWVVLTGALILTTITVLLKFCGRRGKQEFPQDQPLLSLLQPTQSLPLLQRIWPALSAAALAEVALGAIPIKFYSLSGLLLGISASIVVWRIGSRGIHDQEKILDQRRTRVGIACLLVVLFTCFALMPALRNPVGVADVLAFFDLKASASTSLSVKKRKDGSSSIDSAYAGLILLTPPKPHPKLTPPSPRNPWLVGGRPISPLVIPFDGVYWYFRFPYKRPRPDAHIVRADPAKAEIRSTSKVPLLMEAHQNLGSHIEVNCCSKIRLTLQNADNRPGDISLELLLRDTAAPGSGPQSLGFVTVPSSQLQVAAIRPSEETLTFAVPPHFPIERFDEITVVVHPAYGRQLVGAKISIKNFVLVPH